MTTETPSTSRGFGEWVRYIWDEGLARHVVIEKEAEGKRPVNLPLTFVLVGGLLAPWLLALGVLVAVLRGYAIRVEGGGEGESSLAGAADEVDEAAADVADEAQSVLDEAVDETADLAGEAVDAAEEAGEAIAESAREAAADFEARLPEGESRPSES